MDFNKCSRCGNFFVSKEDVCPKCKTKDNLEFETFKNYIAENGINQNLDIISSETGIAVKNLNRFIGYAGYNKSIDKLGNIQL
jgi:hypothetical protein